MVMNGRVKFERVAAFLVLATFLSATFSAACHAGQSAQEAPEQSGPVLRVTSGLVNLYAVVLEKNRPVSGLNKEDFEITEDDKPQTIQFFSRETDTPLTLGILVDTSVSQGHVLGIEQREAKQFLDQVLTKKDLAFVLHFDVDVELLQDLSNNKRLLAQAIDSTEINGGGGGVTPGPFPSTGPRGTDLHDAIYLSARELLKHEVGRKVIILLTDGVDAGSSKSLNDALEAAQRSDVIVYAVAITDRHFYSDMQFGFGNGESTLKKYAEQTGGRVIQVDRLEDTGQAFKEIADELRTQYSIGYTSSNEKRDGSFRKIQIKIRDHNYKVQSRRGYYAPKE